MNKIKAHGVNGDGVGPGVATPASGAAARLSAAGVFSAPLPLLPAPLPPSPASAPGSALTAWFSLPCAGAGVRAAQATSGAGSASLWPTTSQSAAWQPPSAQDRVR